MHPIKKMWMFQHWMEDQKEDMELAKNHAYLLGSFWNPEAVGKLMDDGNTYKSTEQDLEASMKLVEQDRNKKMEDLPVKRKRRKKKIKE